MSQGRQKDHLKITPTSININAEKRFFKKSYLTIEYKDFTCHFSFDGKDKLFRGRIANIESFVVFEGNSIRELREAFYRAVDERLNGSENVSVKRNVL